MNLSSLLVMLAFSPAQSDASPLAKVDTFPAALQWKAVEACPKLNVRSGELITGSAVALAVKDGYVWLLTASHVAKEGAPIDADFYRRTSYPGRDYTLCDAVVVVKNETADLAIIKVPLEVKPPVDERTAASVPQPSGDEKVPPTLRLAAPGQRPRAFPFPVLAVGCDDGGSSRCTDDTAIARTMLRRRENKVAFFWETSAKSLRGRSGGPLLDNEGLVIGICSGTQGERGYYTHIDEIHAWLKPLGYEWLWKADASK